jgi:hypothetical protein
MPKENSMKQPFNQAVSQNRPRLSAEDFYYNENGHIVFTAQYHLKRGYCCRSQCRHCPYDNKK